MTDDHLYYCSFSTPTFSLNRVPAKLVADWFIKLNTEGLEARIAVRIL